MPAWFPEPDWVMLAANPSPTCRMYAEFLSETPGIPVCITVALLLSPIWAIKASFAPNSWRTVARLLFPF